MIKRLVLSTVIGLGQLPVQVQPTPTVTPMVDQAFTNHSANMISNNCPACSPGVAYIGALGPTLTTYTPGMIVVLFLDQPTAPTGVSFNLNQLGPINFVGTCKTVCLIVLNNNRQFVVPNQ